jgi:hypothetical protein
MYVILQFSVLMQLSEYSVKMEWDKTFANKVVIGSGLMSNRYTMLLRK